MADILGRAESVMGSAFTSDAGTLNFTGLPSAVGLLVQNMQLAYRQTVNQLFEVGSPRRYYVAGRTSGNLGLGRVVGPVGIQKAFYSLYGDVCRADQHIIRLGVGTGCRGGTGNALTNDNLSIPGFGATGIAGLTGAFAGAGIGAAVGAAAAGMDAASFSVYNPVVTDFGVIVGAQDMLINESMGMMFGMLK